MPDSASTKEGGRVLMASSSDEGHPWENAIDGEDRSFWISTGLYPQELLIALAYPSLVSVVNLRLTNVREVRVEGCAEPAPVNFQILGTAQLPSSSGALQIEEFQCGSQTWQLEFLKVVIVSGWHDFCSVHGVRVNAERAAGACKAGGPVSVASESSQIWQQNLSGYRVGSTSGSSCTTELNDTGKAISDVCTGGVDLTAVGADPQRSMWLAQVKNDGLALRFAGGLQSDREVVMLAVTKNGDALRFAAPDLQADRNVVLPAVRQKGTAVSWAAESLRSDKEVAMAAVAQNGNALQSLGDSARDDRDVVLCAVKQKGSSLRYASRALRVDTAIVTAACETYYWTKEELDGLVAESAEELDGLESGERKRSDTSNSDASPVGRLKSK